MTFNYFAIIGIEPAARVDLADLERRYLELQHRFHPDRHAHRQAPERRAAMEASARINEAYHLLRDPISRCSHLLSLRGAEVHGEATGDLPAEFLVRQLECHEALEAARCAADIDHLNALTEDLRTERRLLESRLHAMLDEHDDDDDDEALGILRQLMFLRRLIAQAQAAADAVEFS